MDIALQIRRILTTRPEFRRKVPAGLKDTDPLLESGIVDSFGLIEFASQLEKAFGVHLEPEDLVRENFESIARAAALVGRRLAAAPRPAGEPDRPFFLGRRKEPRR